MKKMLFPFTGGSKNMDTKKIVREDKQQTITPILEALYPDEIEMLYHYRVNKLMHFHNLVHIEYKNQNYIGNPLIGFVEVFMENKEKDFEIVREWLNKKGMFGEIKINSKEKSIKNEKATDV